MKTVKFRDLGNTAQTMTGFMPYADSGYKIKHPKVVLPPVARPPLTWRARLACVGIGFAVVLAGVHLAGYL